MEYDYEKMRKDAEIRVRKMKEQSEEAVRDMRQREEVPAYRVSFVSDSPQNCRQMPLNLPEKQPELSGKRGKAQSASRSEIPVVPPSPPKEKPADKPSARQDDSDRALILALCMLLQAEQADPGLILALLFLLT